MKEYKYNGYTFRLTDTYTENLVYHNWSRSHVKRLAQVYEIDGLKERCTRPFLTSIKQCKEYIRQHAK